MIHDDNEPTESAADRGHAFPAEPGPPDVPGPVAPGQPAEDRYPGAPLPPPPPGWGQSGSTGVPAGAPWGAAGGPPPYRSPDFPGAGPSGWPGGWGGGGYGPTPPGGGVPGWMAGPPSGDPWSAPPADPASTNRAGRRHRRRRAVAAGATAGLLAVAAAGVLVGHAAWPTDGTTATASAPAGTGSTGTGSAPTGTGGTGGTISPSTGSGASGSSPFGSLGSSSTATNSTAAGAPADTAAIAKKVDPGLVDIDTTLGYQDEAAAGTGMVLTSTGEILTNNHVIDGATSIRVTDIGNGKTYSATVVGYDRTQDVAVLQLVKASGLTTVNLGNSSTVTKGEGVVGIGNAGGAGGTPSYAGGSVTALSQSITASDEGGGNSEKLVGLIETNAGIQAGDSGGSLVNSSGQVIGMDTAAESGTQFQSATTTTAYAIPINEALSLAGQITSGKGSSVVHIGTTALLGVEVETAGSSVFGGTSSATSGALVAGVVSSSPAAKAGLVEGDTITAVDGQSVSSPTALTNDLGGEKPGGKVQLTYQDQSGTNHTVTVTLGSGPPQ
jgi:S1-C subfamily serine protease